MRRFWDDVIQPCFLAANVRRIVEVGSDHGENTVKLVNYACQHDGFVYSIDPAPQFDYQEAFAGKEDYYEFFRTTSVNAIPRIRDYDAILIDGDHNWYTVYTELQLVLRNTERFPLVFFHDVSWPYDRRDLYYNPDTIPPGLLNAYKVSGIDPDTDELSDKGFNHKLRNSVNYTNYHCGVLTAVEDFVRENQPRFEMMMIPIMSGLGIMIDTTQTYPDELYEKIRELTPTGPLAKLMRFSDKWFAKTHSRMEQQMETIERLRKDSGEKAGEIERLRKDGSEKAGEIERLRKDGSEKAGEIERLRKDSGEKAGEIERLRKENDAQTVKITQLLKEEQENLDRIEQLDKDNGVKALELERFRKAEREKDEELERIWEDNNEKAGEIERLREDGSEKDREIERLDIEGSRKAEMLDRLQKDCRAKDEQIRQKLDQLRDAQGKITSLQQKETRTRAELTAAARERDQYRNQLRSSEKQLAIQERIAKENAAIADIHYNSISYQIGRAFVEASKSFKAFLMLPIVLLRLYRRGREQSRKREAAAQNGDTPVPSAQESHISEKTGDPPAKGGPPQPIQIVPDVKPNASLSPDPEEEELRRQHKARVRFYEGGETPTVSIIIVNRNGLGHLKTLFASLKNARFYERYELIVVDNCSDDGSVEFLNDQALGKKLQIIRNERNESFSHANNQAAQVASGSYLLFLNNDIEVTDGWLDELLLTSKEQERAGAVGAKLIYPKGIGGINKGKDHLIQHRGIVFKEDSFNNTTFIRPVNLGNGERAWPDDGHVRQLAAVTAAVLLVSKEAFESVGGFDEQYIYGYEDVDLCLKLHQKGYRNYYTPKAMLFHHEFGSQSKDDNRDIVARRTANIEHFRDKWQSYLTRQLADDRIAGTRIFSDQTLCFAFAVTEAGENVSAGDYFTALELASSLQKHGHRVKYLCRRGGADWYDVGKDVDVLVSMLDAYDLGKAYNLKEGLVTVAWARNWFTRWVENPSIKQYTMVFGSSKTACDFMERATGRYVTLFPIATNADRFLSVMEQPEQPQEREKYGCDYVFTGSYWNDPREIIDILDPKNLPYRFKVFGKNWDQVPKLAEYSGGFLNYEEMPKVYKYTSIVLDDANRVTIEYGAVNSRVFDALAAGRLVLTNGAKGADETFGGMLPVFRSKEELNNELAFYMEHPEERDSLVKKLQSFVLKNHTYDIRANTLLRLLLERSDSGAIPAERRIAIMAPVPKWSEVNSWGDYHFAVAMKKCFEGRGYHVEIRILPEWEKDFDGKYVIVLRGLSVYQPKKQHVNLMWNISHPDDVPIEEYNLYDAVFISSLRWAEHIRHQASVPVFPLLQCTDPEVFNGPAYGDGEEKRYELLFVGNSRKVFRKILKDLLPTPYDLSVFGTNWKGLIDDRYIKGESIPNDQLGREYHDAAILLNDHWDDMKEKGFISNRIFDGLSAGAFLISDEIAGIDEVLKDCIVTYRDREDLAEKVKYYLEHPEEREMIARRGMEIVREKHTFRARVDEMIDWMCQQQERSE